MVEWDVVLLEIWEETEGFYFSTIPEGYDVLKLGDIPTEEWVGTYEHLPEEAFTYFRPHKFDAKRIKRLQ